LDAAVRKRAKALGPPKAAAGKAPARTKAPEMRHQGDVSCVAFTPDGARLVSAGYDGLIRVWDVATELELRQMRVGPSLWRFTLSSTLVAAASSKITLFDHASGDRVRQLAGHGSNVDCEVLSFVPSRDRLVSCGGMDVMLWDVATGARLARRKLVDAPADLAVSPDGRRCAVVTEGGLRMLDAETLDIVGQGVIDELAGVAWGPAGLLAACCGEGLVSLDPISLEPITRLPRHAETICGLTRDGAALLVDHEGAHAA
jgi:WD40 repeat protein